MTKLTHIQLGKFGRIPAIKSDEPVNVLKATQTRVDPSAIPCLETSADPSDSLLGPTLRCMFQSLLVVQSPGIWNAVKGVVEVVQSRPPTVGVVLPQLAARHPMGRALQAPEGQKLYRCRPPLRTGRPPQLLTGRVAGVHLQFPGVSFLQEGRLEVERGMKFSGRGGCLDPLAGLHCYMVMD